MFKKSLITFFTVSIFLFIFNLAPPAQASFIPALIPDDGNMQEGDYQLADFVALAVNATQIIMAVAASLALLAFIVGGFIFLVSRGNPEMLTKGRNSLIGGVIGLFIVFFSWTIVDFTLAKLGYDSSVFGKWYERPGRLSVPKPTVASKGQATTGAGVSTTGLKSAWPVPKNSSTEKQLQYLSKSMTDLMDCVSNQVDPMTFGQITSVVQNNFTDTDLQNLSSSPCSQPGCLSSCVHTCGSCHYSGNAIDLNVSNASISKSAIRNYFANCIGQSGARAEYANNSTMIHLSSSGCKEKGIGDVCWKKGIDNKYHNVGFTNGVCK